MRQIETIIHEVIKHLVLIVIVNFLWNFFLHYKDIVSLIRPEELWSYLLVGGTFLITYGFFREHFLFFETLGHEISHMLTSILSLNKIVALFASKDVGGSLQYLGKENFLIALAPYTIPFSTIFWVLLSFVVISPLSLIFKYAALIFFVWYLVSLINQFGKHQPDLYQHNFIHSTIFVVLANTLNILFMAFFLTGTTTLFLKLFMAITKQLGEKWITLLF